ncbi:hypothetical protein PILCRDRAFT_14983, partial [Piloderma croceum F 1598]
TKRKPDIILLKKGDKPAWPVVCAVGEVTAEAGFPSRIRNTIQQKSFLTFATQPARRFTVSLAFSKDCFQFVTCDRAGVVTSTRVNIDDGALNLLQIVAGLMFGSDELIGYDKSMHRGPDGSIKSITVGKEAEYTVIEPIFSSETVRGRATRCWRVRRDGKQYVLKDSWCHRNWKSEAIILEKLVDMEGVPHLINSDDVMAHGQIDSTAVHRVGLSYKEERVHRRLVVKPVATPLYTFESKKELIQAFVDIVKTHKALCEQRHILHRDISLNNLMLYEHSPEDSTRRGLLIDFDYSTEIGGPNGPSDNHRTGTGPFMAIEVLRHADSQAIIQKPNHDLESIFYVLLCFCLRYNGPHGQRANLGPMPVDKFYLANESYDSLATWKTGVLFEYEDQVLRHIPPYFADLKECLRQLFDRIFCPRQGAGPNGDVVVLRAFHKNDATHDAMLEVLENTLAQLPDVDTVPPRTSAGK